MEKLLESIEERLALVPEGLRAHVQRTRATARNIACLLYTSDAADE